MSELVEKQPTYTYEEALEESIKYFDGNELSAKVFLDKYALRTGSGDLIEKTPDDMHRRISKEFARIEKFKFDNTNIIPLTEDEIYLYLKEFKNIIPQGSPMYGIGNHEQYVTLSNCYVLETPLDSYSSILKTDEQLVQISKRRGGVGIDISNLRPDGSPTRNSSRTSTGIIPFMERYSNSIREVGQCLDENQKILTKRGLIKIKNVNIGDFVWTKVGWIKVTNKYNNGNKKLWKTTTTTGYSIVSTDEHIFVSEKDGELTEKKLKEFNIGDEIVLIPGNNEHDKEYVKLENNIDYEVKEYNNSNRLKEYELPDILNEELAYILGYSYGNGNSEYDALNEKCGLRLSIPTKWSKIKEQLIDNFSYIINKEINIRNGDGACENLNLYSKYFMKYLEVNELLKSKADNLNFPEKIFESPKSVQSSFISGYFDADGYNSGSKKGYCFSSIDREFLSHIQKILFSYGICSKIYKEDRKNKEWNDLYNLSIVGKTSQEKMVDFCKNSIKVQSNPFISKRECWLTPYKSKTLGIKRSKDRNYIPDNSQNLSLSCFEKAKTDFDLEFENLTKDTIESIEEYGNGIVYDLELEKEHLFYCEGFQVHNSGRRGALMITIDIHHPETVKLDDSVDFCSVKKNLEKVTGANISIRLSDEFLKAVENDEEYEVRFPVNYKEKGIKPKISYKQNARKAWKKIIHHAWDNAEPGLLFWDNIVNESPADCYSEYGFKTSSVNPCAEISLCEFDSCRLLLVNTFGSVKNPYTSHAKFDWIKFKRDSYIAQRLMDDLVDLELQAIERIIYKIHNDPEPKEIKAREIKLWSNIQEKCKWGRRTGTGITALGDTMASLGIKYGSKESIEFTEEVYKTLKLGAYRASVDLSKELSPFPIWDAEKEAENPFLLRIKEDDEELYNDMKKYGRRNIALLTTAPAGSVSILACMEVDGKKYFNTTSGIEPQYSTVPYIRKRKINPSDKNSRIDETDSNGDSWQKYSVYPSGVKAWMDIHNETDISKSPYASASAEELDWGKRVELQAKASKHIDHSISSTINLPNSITEEEVANIYETAWKMNCKGITVYRDGCRTGVLVKDTPKENSNKIIKTDAPKRPKTLECDIFHPTLKGEKYYVVVGLYEDDPYEVFTGLNKDEEGNSFIPKSVENGMLTKKSRGKYLLTSNEKEYSLTNGHSDDNAEAITRLISTSLRHGADISFIVHQLEKTKGDLLSFSKVLARTLKKYIKDDTKVYGEECPSCNHGDTLQRREGCITCINCGFTKCG